MSSTQDQIHDGGWKILQKLYRSLLIEVDEERNERDIDLLIADPFQIRDVGLVLGYDTSAADEVAAFEQLDRLLEELEEAVDNRSAEDAEHLFKEVKRACRRLEIPRLDGFLEYFDETLATVRVSESDIIFAPEPPPIYVPNLIVTAQQFLIDKIKHNPDAIFGIAPRAFEELIAEIFFSHGFHVELTQATRDGGRDILAIHQIMGVRLKYLIECKRYAPHRKVSLAIVQRLYGVKMAEAANKAILATTSGFTRDARVFASQHLWDLDLKGYEEIMQWVRGYRAA